MINKAQDCRDCFECESKSPLFAKLSLEDLAIINRERFSVGYRPGELIFKQGSSFTHVIALTRGKVKLYIEGSRDIILRIAKPVELIMGPGMFIDNHHFNSAAALDEVSACYIDVNAFMEVFRRNSAFAEVVTREISEKGLYTLRRLMSLNLKQTPGLVAEALVLLSENVFESEEFDLLLSRQELADFCGITKESVIRVLKDLKEENSIRLNGNQLKILNLNTLKKISSLG